MNLTHLTKHNVYRFYFFLIRTETIYLNKKNNKKKVMQILMSNNFNKMITIRNSYDQVYGLKVYIKLYTYQHSQRSVEYVKIIAIKFSTDSIGKFKKNRNPVRFFSF